MNIQELIGSAPTILLIVASVLVILVVAFILFFLVPGVLHWFRLRRIQRRIATFSSQNFAAEFKKVFAGDKRLSHLWKEYQDSLHFQHEDRDGQAVVSAVRATVPAELFFNSQFVVDSGCSAERRSRGYRRACRPRHGAAYGVAAFRMSSRCAVG